MTDHDVRRGARIYTRRVLRLYDLVVIRFSNTFAWRCPSRLMLAQYDRCLRTEHLEVGPGTGWYLAHADLPDGARIDLLDLNPESLRSARARIGPVARKDVVADVLQPLPEGTEAYDSIGLNYVLHCVPGTWETKGRAFAHLADRLVPGGVLFGSTILGDGAAHNALGRGLLALYNRIGVFHNRADDVDGLEEALRRVFRRVEIRMIGTVAMFAATDVIDR